MSRNSGTNNSSNVNVTTTSGIRKYTLPRPDIQKNLNFRLGPPEFYPISNDNIEQEDTLNERTIAEGFVEPQLVQEEYGTFSTGNQFNTFDLRGRVLQSVKEIEWKKLCGAKPKQKTDTRATTKKGKGFPDFVPINQEQWIKRLAVGDEPLHKLATAVPFPGGKDTYWFTKLIKEQVPLLRASWYIKIIYLNKQKDQRDLKPEKEWTRALINFLTAQIKELASSKEPKKALQGLNYILKLISWNYHEGLLDCEEWFTRVIQLLQESPVTKPEELCLLIIAVLAEYLHDICRLSKSLIRQLAIVSMDKLHQLAPVMHEAREPLRKLLYSKGYTCLRSVLRYVLVEAPDTIATLDHKSLSNCLQITNPITQDDDPADMLSDLVQEQLWHESEHIVQQLNAVHQNFLQSMASSRPKPDLIDELDAFWKKPDINELAVSLFPAADASDSASLLTEDTTIMLLCEWAITAERPADYLKTMVVCSVLSKHSSKVAGKESLSNNGLKPALQSTLNRFLESYKVKDPEEKMQLYRLFGELIRCGLFSHDYYVRYLISKGVLEPQSNEEMKTLQSTYLEQFPIFEDNPNYQHEQNQRRALTTQSQEAKCIGDFRQTIIKQLCSVATSLDEVGDHLRLSTRYIQLSVTQWLTTMIKRDLGALSELNLPKLIAVTRLLKAVQDYVAITDIMLFLLKHNCSPLLHSSVLITLIRKYEVIFVYQNQLTELSTAILEKCKDATKNEQVYMLDYLTELMDRYNDVKVLSSWRSKHQSRLQECSSVVRRDLEKVLLSEVVNVSTLQSNVQCLMPALASLVFEQHNLHQMSIAAAMRTLLHTALRYLGTLSRQSLAQEVSNFVSVLQELHRLSGYVQLSFLSVLRSDFFESSHEQQQDVLLDIVRGMVARHCMLLSHIICVVVIPALSKILKVLEESKDAAVPGMTTLGMQLVNILFVSNTPAEELEFSGETALLPHKYQQSLTSLVLGCYKCCVASTSRESLLSIIEPILRKEPFRRLCNTSSHSNELYECLHKLHDPLTARAVFNIIMDKKDDVKWSHATINDVGLRLVHHSLGKISKWTVGRTLLDIRLLLDVWATFEDPSKTLIQLFFYQLMHSLHASLLCKLLSALGISTIQEQFLLHAQNILKTPEVLLGHQSLKQYFMSTLSAAALQKDVVMNDSDSSVDELESNEALENSFLELVVGSLNQLGTEDQKKVFAVALLEQLEIITQQLQGNNTAARSEYTLDLSSTSIAALQRSLFIRATILVPLLPLIKKQKKACKQEEMCKMLLVLLSKPAVQADEDLFEYLLTILDTLLNETNNQEEISKQRAFYEKLQLQFIELEFPPSMRARIEQTLPLFSGSMKGVYVPVQPATTKNNKRIIECWSLLEDYPNAPLSPSQLGEKVERKDMTYVTEVFAKKPRVT